MLQCLDLTDKPEKPVGRSLACCAEAGEAEAGLLSPVTTQTQVAVLMPV